MKLQISEIPSTKETFVMLWIICPSCHEYINFAMHKDGLEAANARIKYLKGKAEYWENRCLAMEDYAKATLINQGLKGKE